MSMSFYYLSDMLKSRARNLVSIFHQKDQRNCQESVVANEYQGDDQTDKSAQKASKRHNLDMERFITQGNKVFQHSKYRKFLVSSSDEDSIEEYNSFKTADNRQKLRVIDRQNMVKDTSMDSDESSGEDKVYAIDALTGEWKACRQQPNFPEEHFNETYSNKDSNASRLKNIGKKH